VPGRKTGSARRALATRGAALDLGERRLPVLLDAWRSTPERASMRGADTSALRQQPQDGGCLQM